MLAPFRLLLALLLVGGAPALAEDTNKQQTRAASTVDTTPPGTLNPSPLPPLANPDAPNTPAKELFARKLTPAPGPASSRRTTSR